MREGLGGRVGRCPVAQWPDFAGGDRGGVELALNPAGLPYGDSISKPKRRGLSPELVNN